MKRLKITRKKTAGYREQDKKKAAAYQAEISACSVETIAYVDECGFDTYLYRKYGYAARGQKVFGQISGCKYKRCGIVAAQLNGRILAPLQYDGTMDSSLFEFWFTSQPASSNLSSILLSTFGPGSNDIFPKSFLFPPLSIMPCLMLFNFGNYMSRKNRFTARRPLRPGGEPRIGSW